jgi:hypothetical protein
MIVTSISWSVFSVAIVDIGGKVIPCCELIATLPFAPNRLVSSPVAHCGSQHEVGAAIFTVGFEGPGAITQSPTRGAFNRLVQRIDLLVQM